MPMHFSANVIGELFFYIDLTALPYCTCFETHVHTFNGLTVNHLCSKKLFGRVETYQQYRLLGA